MIETPELTAQRIREYLSQGKDLTKENLKSLEKYFIETGISKMQKVVRELN